MAKKILIADDEPDIWNLLDYTFSQAGYTTFHAENGKQALEIAEEVDPDIILLDIMMPEIDGIEVCRTLRSKNKFRNTVILILTARGEEYSEIAGLEAGADDYIIKPVKLRSLLKRIDVIEKRISPNNSPNVLEFKNFKIDRDSYQLIIEGDAIKLPRKEFELLYILASNNGKVISRQFILDQIWGKEVVVVDRTIDVHIRRIRKKIGVNYIRTIKGVGYKFTDKDLN